VEVHGPLVQGDQLVAARGAIAGATVEVYAVGGVDGMGVYLGSTAADALHAVTSVVLGPSS
jgi:hypothetical protein